MQNSNFIRLAGLWCMVGAVVAAVGATVTATIPPAVPITNVSYPYTPSVYILTEFIWAATHILMLIGVVGLARSGAVGESRFGRIGLWVTAIGMVLQALCEIAFAFYANAMMNASGIDTIESVIGMSTLVQAIGFVLVGTAVLRARHWQGWQAYTPLLCGLFVFVVILPVLIMAPDAFIWPVVGWSLCFIPFGLALYRDGAARTTNTPAVGLRA